MHFISTFIFAVSRNDIVVVAAVVVSEGNRHLTNNWFWANIFVEGFERETASALNHFNFLDLFAQTFTRKQCYKTVSILRGVSA